MNRGKWIGSLLAGGAVCALLVSTGAVAQAPPSPPTFPWAGQDATIPAPKTVTPPQVNYNPKDFTGVWLRQGGQALADTPPKLTPKGLEIFKKSVVSVSNELQTSDNAPPPIQGNDPIMRCDPWGFPRVLWDFAAPSEFGHLPNRIVQFFEWTHVWRDIWMDGRQLPKDPDPRWMGYSVGHWEGDTLVVETNGMDEKTWMDEVGHRHTANARFVERYRRPTPTTLEYNATLTDPEYYAEPWVGTQRTFRLLPMPGWPQSELREEFCAPSTEQNFNDTIRDPAGGKK